MLGRKDETDARTRGAKRNEPNPTKAHAQDLNAGSPNTDFDCPLGILPVVVDGDIFKGRRILARDVEGTPQNAAVAGRIDIVSRRDHPASLKAEGGYAVTFDFDLGDLG